MSAALGDQRSDMRGIFFCVLAALVIGGCLDGNGHSAVPPLTMGESVLLKGRVTGIDSTPIFVDGDGLIFVQNEVYGCVVIHIPARERLCHARGLDGFSLISAGDDIRVLGSVTGSRDVTVCAEETHFLEKLN